VADDLTPQQRSYAMSRIRSRGNASTEQRMVALLRAERFKGWRRHVDLPGRPDFVFRRERLAIFVDGCFWHHCPRCFKMPASNLEYWIPKIQGNRRRDRRVTRELQRRGWRVIRVWEHSFSRPGAISRRIRLALEANPEDLT
jgi:DNA mismatch endonuclease (patch repair protein)